MRMWAVVGADMRWRGQAYPRDQAEDQARRLQRVRPQEGPHYVAPYPEAFGGKLYVCGSGVEKYPAATFSMCEPVPVSAQ